MDLPARAWSNVSINQSLLKRKLHKISERSLKLAYVEENSISVS